MADLEVRAGGDFSGLVDEAKKLTGGLKETTGYVQSLEDRMKSLKAEMRSASATDLPKVREQFLQVRSALKEAQYGTESFTKKIGGEFDRALEKAGKRLFDLGNIAKAAIIGGGVAGLVTKFIEATGVADALSKSIEGVVNHLKNLNRTRAELSIDQSLPLLKRIDEYLDKRSPREKLISDTEAEINRLLGDKFKADNPTLRRIGDTFAGEVITSSKLLEQINDQIIRKGVTESDLLQQQITALEIKLMLLRQINSEVGGSSSGGGRSSGGGPKTTAELAALEPFVIDNVDRNIRVGIDRGDDGREGGLWTKYDEENMRSAIETEYLLRTENVQKLYDVQIQNALKIGDVDLAIKLENEKNIASFRDRALHESVDILAAGTYSALTGSLNAFVAQLRNQLLYGGIRGAFQGLFSLARGKSFGPLDFLGSLIGIAGGGASFYTSGPQLMLVGDNPGGVERVNVEPITGRGITRGIPGGMAFGGGTMSSGRYAGGVESGGGGFSATLNQTVRAVITTKEISRSLDENAEIYFKQL